MARLRFSDFVKTMSAPERITQAKEKTRRVVDHVHYLLDLHENNAITLYSDTLSSQIPRSFAANAFNVFQQALHQFELIRLCALWDNADPAKESLPTVIELIDAPEVIEALAEETRSHWSNRGGHFLNPPSDPELLAEAEDHLRRFNEAFGEEQAQKVRSGLLKAIEDGREIMSSARLASVMNLRDKYLAHSLSTTRREQKGEVEQMKYGDETAILEASLPIIEALYCWVNGCGFRFEDSRRIDRKNAESLWKGCTFNVLR